MKGVLSVTVLLALVAAAAAAAVKKQGYHATIGIPLATRLRQAENERIINGKPAPLGAHPYLVGMVIPIGEHTSVCGSSLLTTTRAVTAAHCIDDSILPVTVVTMVFGSEYIFIGGLRVDTDQFELHKDWNIGNTFGNDIAMVSFPAVQYTEFIQPIALPTGHLLNSDFIGRTAYASGYGMIGDGIGLAPNQVQSHVEVQVISNDLCRASYGFLILDSNICTSGQSPIGNVGTCSSDSGGPLSIDDNGRKVLIGVVSFGSMQCEGGSPSAFARVTSYIDWIQARL